MKKLLALVLLAVTLLSLAACGQKEIDLSIYDGTWVCGEDVIILDSADTSYTLSRSGRVGEGEFSKGSDGAYISFNGMLYKLRLKDDTLTLKQREKDFDGETLGKEAFIRVDSATVVEYTLDDIDPGDFFNQYGEVLCTNGDMTCSYKIGGGFEGKICNDNDGMGWYFLCSDGLRAYIIMAEDKNSFTIPPYEGEEGHIRGTYVPKHLASEEVHKLVNEKWEKYREEIATAEVTE